MSCPNCGADALVIDRDDDMVSCSHCGATWESIDSFIVETRAKEISEIKDERVKRFCEIMDEQYNWEFNAEEATDVISVLDQINEEFDSSRNSDSLRKDEK